MIGFRSGEAACSRCPFSLRCWQGKTLLVDLGQGETRLGERFQFHKKKVLRNRYQVAYCPRCYCVHFRIDHERYLCGILRTGAVTPGYEKGLGPVYHAVGGRFRQGTTTTGCVRDKEGKQRQTCSFQLDELKGSRSLRQMPVVKRVRDRYRAGASGFIVHETEWIDEDGNLVEFDPWDCFDEFEAVLTKVYGEHAGKKRDA